MPFKNFIGFTVNQAVTKGVSDKKYLIIKEAFHSGVPGGNFWNAVWRNLLSAGGHSRPARVSISLMLCLYSLVIL